MQGAMAKCSRVNFKARPNTQTHTPARGENVLPEDNTRVTPRRIAAVCVVDVWSHIYRPNDCNFDKRSLLGAT